MFGLMAFLNMYYLFNFLFDRECLPYLLSIWNTVLFPLYSSVVFRLWMNMQLTPRNTEQYRNTTLEPQNKNGIVNNTSITLKYSIISKYNTFITIVLYDYNVVFLCSCSFLFILWWVCWNANMNPQTRSQCRVSESLSWT